MRSDLKPADLLPLAAMDLADGDWVMVVPVDVQDLGDDKLLVQLRPVGSASFSAN